MLIRLTEVDVYDEEEINTSELGLVTLGLGQVSFDLYQWLWYVSPFQDALLGSHFDLSQGIFLSGRLFSPLNMECL